MTPAQQLLVTALDSGEFTQAQGQLRTPDGHCCLGVACEVFRRETGRGEWVLMSPGDPEADPDLPSVGYVFVVDGERDGVLLPDVVRKWLGLPRGSTGADLDEPVYDTARPGLVAYNSLGGANDHGLKFAEIAGLIRDGKVQTTPEPRVN